MLMVWQDIAPNNSNVNKYLFKKSNFCKDKGAGYDITLNFIPRAVTLKSFNLFK
jgi:hypothetical protein